MITSCEFPRTLSSSFCGDQHFAGHHWSLRQGIWHFRFHLAEWRNHPSTDGRHHHDCSGDNEEKRNTATGTDTDKTTDTVGPGSSLDEQRPEDLVGKWPCKYVSDRY